jgi:hypothetical protein
VKEQPKEWAILVKSAGGETSMKMKRREKTRMLKCLVESCIPSRFRIVPENKLWATNIKLEPTEQEIRWVTLEKANRIKRCLEPLSPLVKVEIKKMEEIL